MRCSGTLMPTASGRCSGSEVRMQTWATVKKIGLALPDVEAGTSWGSPALKVRDTMFACVPTNKAAEKRSIVVRLDVAQRDELLAAEPDVYYLKEHYVN